MYRSVPDCSSCAFDLLFADCLLPGHDDAHLGFGVDEQFAAHVDRHGVDRAGERERAAVVGRDGRSGVRLRR